MQRLLIIDAINENLTFRKIFNVPFIKSWYQNCIQPLTEHTSIYERNNQCKPFFLNARTFEPFIVVMCELTYHLNDQAKACCNRNLYGST